MANSKILVVEDERDILDLVRFHLEKEGHRVTTAQSGEEALMNIRANAPDLIVLDLLLPNMDGLEVCRIIKNNAETQQIPIVMLTAKGEESDVVAGLEIGADDYIIKPFSPRVLMARVKAVLRRKEQKPSTVELPIKREHLQIHPGRREVLVDRKKIDLTYSEFQVLFFLAKRPGWVFTRSQIVTAVRGDEYPVTDRSVDVIIVGLRKRLGRYGKLVETVRGVGYRFKE
jgi:two-component system phosphate regulon response regulator PhoB